MKTNARKERRPGGIVGQWQGMGRRPWIGQLLSIHDCAPERATPIIPTLNGKVNRGKQESGSKFPSSDSKQTERRFLWRSKTDLRSAWTRVGNFFVVASLVKSDVLSFSAGFFPERALTTDVETLYNGSCRPADIQHVVCRSPSDYNLCWRKPPRAGADLRGNCPWQGCQAVSSCSLVLSRTALGR